MIKICTQCWCEKNKFEDFSSGQGRCKKCISINKTLFSQAEEQGQKEWMEDRLAKIKHSTGQQQYIHYTLYLITYTGAKFYALLHVI